MKRAILVIDPDVSGHHPNYLGLVADAFAEAGHAVTVAADLSDATIQQQVAGQPWTTLDFRVPSQGVAPLRDLDLVHDQIQYWRRCRALIDGVRSSGWQGKIFFPYLDRIVHAIGLLGSPGAGVSCAGILMRPQFGARQAAAPLKRRLRQRLLSRNFRRVARRGHLDHVFVIDPLTAADTAAAITGTLMRLTELADPADCFRTRSPAEARARLGLPEQGHFVLVYGEISRRKGVAELIAGLAACPGLGQALVVGRGNPDLGDSLREAAGGSEERLNQLMIRIDRRVSDVEERLVFEAVDSVWVAYHDHPGMSGVLVQAGQMELPVFGCATGAIGKYCRERGVGIAFEPGDAGQVATALLQIKLEPLKFAAMGKNGFETFKHFTRAGFKKALVDAIE